MTDLLSQLQSATEGSKALSDAVGDFMGAPKRYAHPGAEEPSHRNYTTNLQDAVSLVGDEYDYLVGSGEAWVWPKRPVIHRGWRETVRKRGDEPRALCIAIIKAHESKADAERKQWCENMAGLEGDAEIGAGLIARDPE